MRYTDDDMDELYRRAAENYPLNTNSADWDKVADKLYSLENTGNQKKRSFNSHFLWILLLIPLTFTYYQLDLGVRIAAHQNKVNKEYKNQSLTHENKNHPGNISLQSNSQSEQERIVHNKPINSAEAVILNRNYSDNTYATTNSSYRYTQKINGKDPGNQIFRKDPAFFDVSSQTSINSDQTNDNIEKLPDYLKILIYNSQTNINSVDPGPSEERIVKNDTKLQNRSREHIYTGIIAGIGYSKVKERWSTNPDINAGILIGYSFTSKWNIEGGIYFDKKYYNSEGKYLNTAKLNLPNNTEIIDVNGDCKMIEVPLNIKYNIKTGVNKWFVTSGISTYFMKNENYDYTALYYSTGQYVRHHKTYNNSTNNWLSVFQISTGYSKRLGNLGSLRIEPYIKFPIQGLGIGQLPVLSTGIQVGITRTVF
jgi:hypothetical protein